MVIYKGGLPVGYRKGAVSQSGCKVLGLMFGEVFWVSGFWFLWGLLGLVFIDLIKGWGGWGLH